MYHDFVRMTNNNRLFLFPLICQNNSWKKESLWQNAMIPSHQPLLAETEHQPSGTPVTALIPRPMKICTSKMTSRPPKLTNHPPESLKELSITGAMPMDQNPQQMDTFPPQNLNLWLVCKAKWVIWLSNQMVCKVSFLYHRLYVTFVNAVSILVFCKRILVMLRQSNSNVGHIQYIQNKS